MNVFTLSPRLNFALEQAKQGEDFWDIGCDHGYLGMAALAKKQVSFVYFVDPSKAVMEKLENNFPKQLSRKKVKFVCQNAMHLKTQDVRGTVAIMGMGGKRILDILDAFVLKNAVQGLHIVVQAQTFDLFLEEALLQRNLKLLQQSTITDKRDSRRILVFEVPMSEI